MEIKNHRYPLVIEGKKQTGSRGCLLASHGLISLTRTVRAGVRVGPEMGNHHNQ